jgi:Ras family protein T1
LKFCMSCKQMMKTSVSIVVLGDPQTGKTSLIATLLADTFQESVPSVVPEVTIPPSVTYDKTSTHIIDTSSNPGQRAQEILKADVICVVYAINSPQTFNNIRTYWLPEIRRIRNEAGKSQVPVILVGNKIDLRGDEVANPFLEQEIMPIMEEFKEVETCIECSAKRLLNVHEVFYFAQKAVLYPTAVLYDPSEKCMRDECVSALKRIFKICDRDRDGVLSDEELNHFQSRCFDASLQPSELEGVKDVVRQHTKDGLTDKGLTLVGFLCLHHLFIQKGRLETTWTVLRTFGYADDLSLLPAFLHPRIEIGEGHVCELSPQATSFLTQLFHACDKDEDGSLSPNELTEAFATCIPPAPPFLWDRPLHLLTYTDSHHYLTLSGWLALWNMTACVDPAVAVTYLRLLGWEWRTAPVWTGADATPTRHPPTSTPTPTSPSSHSKQTEAVSADAWSMPEYGPALVAQPSHVSSILRCYVFGAPASGKSSFLRGSLISLASEGEDKASDQAGTRTKLAKATPDDTLPLTEGMEDQAQPPTTSAFRKDTQKHGTSPYRAISQIQITGHPTQYLLLQEFSREEEEIVANAGDELAKCDCICFLYDCTDMDSFAYCARLQRHIHKFCQKRRIPCIYFATHTDNEPDPQIQLTLDHFLDAYELSYPLYVNLREPSSAIYTHLLHETFRLREKMDSKASSKKQQGRLVFGLAVLGLAALGVFLCYQYRNSISNFFKNKPQ